MACDGSPLLGYDHTIGIGLGFDREHLTSVAGGEGHHRGGRGVFSKALWVSRSQLGVLLVMLHGRIYDRIQLGLRHRNGD